MSSIPSQPSPFAPGELTAQAAEERVLNHLRQAARFIRLLDILILLAGAAALLLSVWLVGSVVDHWLFELPTSVRWSVWMAVVATLAWAGATRLVPLLLRRINPIYAAHRIEQIVPEFKNGLISWLELKTLAHSGVPRGVMAALSYRAVRFIGGHDPSATIDTGPLIKRVGAALLLTVVLAVYAMLSPKSLIDSGQRLAMPWVSLSAPTRVRIVEVLPGTCEITQGTSLPIEVQLRGTRQGEPVLVRFDALDGQFSNRRLQLNAIVEGLQYGGALRTGDEGIQQDLRYWVEAGDAVAGPYQITLSPLPSLATQRVVVSFPRYTRWEPQEFTANMDIEALAGSRLQVWAASNQPLDRAMLVVNPIVDDAGTIARAGQYIAMQPEEQRFHGAVKLLEQHESYCLRGYNSRGESNIYPVVRALKVYRDQSPEVDVIGPESRLVRVAPDSRLNLEIRASDPDFGLSKVHVELRLNRHPNISRTLLEAAAEPADPVLSHVQLLPLNIGSLKATPGDRIEIVAVAADNRHDPLTEQLSPNVTRSQPLVLEVVAPAAADIPPPMQRSSEAAPAEAPAAQSSDAHQPPPPTRPEPNQAEQGPPARQAADGATSSSGSGQPDPADESESQGTGQSGQSGQSGQGEQSRQSPSSQSPPGGQSADQPATSDSGQTTGSGTSSSETSTSQGKPATGEPSAEAGSTDPSQDPPAGADQPAADGSTDPSTAADRPSQAARDRSSSQGGHQSQAAGSESPSERQPPGNDSSGQSADPSTSDSVGQPPSTESAQPGANDSADAGQPDAGAPQRQRDQEALQKIREFMDQQQRASAGDQTQPSGDATQPERDGPQQSPSDSNTGSGEQSPGSQTEQSRGQPGEQPGEQSGEQPGDQPGDQPSESQPADGSDSSEDAAAADQSEADSQDPAGQAPQSQPPSDTGPQTKPSQPTASEATSPSAESQQSPGKSESSDGTNQPHPSDGQPSPSQPADSQASPSPAAGEGASDASGAAGADAKSPPPESASPSAPSASQPPAGGQNGGNQASPAQQTPSASNQSGAASQGAAGRPATSGSSTPGPGQGTSPAETADADPRLSGEATDLTLQYLQRQREQPDPELLKQLGWTQNDLREFIDRYRAARGLKAEGRSRLTTEEELQRLNLADPDGSAIGPSGQADAFRQQLDGGGRSRPPERLRKQIEQFQRALQHSRP